MKRFLIRGLWAAAALAVALSAAGCTMVNIAEHVTSGTNSIQASGDLETYIFPSSGFTVADISANLEVIYSSQPSDTVTVEIQENLMEHLTVSVADGKLTVVSDRNFTYTGGKTGKIYIGAPDLERVYIRGGVTMTNADTIVGDSFRMEVSGALDGKLDLQVNSLAVTVSGAGALELTGTADQADLGIYGAGSLEAGGLQTKTAKVVISGAGSADISCSDDLDATISGAGSLTYRGDPNVSRSVFGAGSITQKR